ncbi:hypothetical protein [Streptomyces sp. NPDC059788]|uniref:hypothetical protein n=1 Tax=Streptomyces sp. NPDC059788 TaxID=3346948 RepID=UPI0036535012
MNRGGCQVRRSVARTGVLVLIALLIALCGSAPAALEAAMGQTEAAAMSAEPAADDSPPQANGLRVPRPARTDHSPTTQARTPRLPCRGGRVARLLARWTDPRPAVRNAADDRARHTVLRC